MWQYLDLLDHVIKTGTKKKDRTGTGTISVFGYQMRFNLEEGFPLLTTNTRYLNDNGVRIWNEWADKDGNLGPVYGYQWRSWPADEGKKIDQLLNVISSINISPDSRRHIVSAWNVGELEKMALPPCHIMFQFYVAGGKLSCQLYQRSADIFLGVPFNIASYSLLTLMVAQVTGLKPGDFVHTLGDAHIYLNHLEQVKLQLTRQPYQLPKMVINQDVTDILKFRFDDFKLTDYIAHHNIKGEISV